MSDDELEQWLARVAAGEALPAATLRSMAAGQDFLQLGMLADAARRHRHGSTTTYLRVSRWVEEPSSSAIEPAAGEVRIASAPGSLIDAVRLVETATAVSGGRAVTAFSWSDLERWSADAEGVPAVLVQLGRAGLGGLATVVVDDGLDIDRAVGLLADAGFDQVRLHVAHPATDDRVELWQRVAALQQRLAVIRSVNPLPASVKARQTTGYDDVKMVAVARLAVGAVPSVQLDWTRYGPKLAQVALTVGVDDLDNVSASDAAPEGRRRAPLDEVRRNISSAGFEPVERDGRCRPVVS